MLVVVQGEAGEGGGVHKAGWEDGKVGVDDVGYEEDEGARTGEEEVGGERGGRWESQGREHSGEEGNVAEIHEHAFVERRSFLRPHLLRISTFTLEQPQTILGVSTGAVVVEEGPSPVEPSRVRSTRDTQPSHSRPQPYFSSSPSTKKTVISKPTSIHVSHTSRSGNHRKRVWVGDDGNVSCRRHSALSANSGRK